MERSLPGYFVAPLPQQVFHFAALPVPGRRSCRSQKRSHCSLPSPGWDPPPKNSGGSFHLDGIKASHGVLTSSALKTSLKITPSPGFCKERGQSIGSLDLLFSLRSFWKIKRGREGMKKLKQTLYTNLIKNDIVAFQN